VFLTEREIEMFTIQDEGIGNEVASADNLQEALRLAREHVRDPKVAQAGDPITILQDGKVVWKMVMGADGKVHESPGG
jgi:hypothetical protein